MHFLATAGGQPFRVCPAYTKTPMHSMKRGIRHSRSFRTLEAKTMLLAMKLTIFLITVCMLQASANGFSQQVTFSGKNVPFEKIFKVIEQQTGYVVFYNYSAVKDVKVSAVDVKDTPLSEFLQRCFLHQPFEFLIEGKTILINRKRNTVSLFMLPVLIKGRVVNERGEPVVATITVKGTSNSATTNANGEFTLSGVDEQAVLVITGVSIQQREVKLEGRTDLGQLVMKTKVNELEDVAVTFSTGYQDIPKERATGSFVQIDNKAFNRATGASVLQRLEGITNGLVFNRQNLRGESVSSQPQLRVRGVSTILGNTAPLIIINNFPFEGDINSINPNDVESVTILKDAAAASIWGARAGNGVIVITTKSGKYGQQTRISINSNVVIGDRPDLFFSRDFLPSPTVMEIQKDFFQNNSYNISNMNNIPLYVELLIKKRDGLISDQDFLAQEARYSRQDIRNDWDKYLYQRSVLQQNSLNIQGGGLSYKYSFSANYDKNREMFVGNKSNRLNLSLQNTFRIRPNLELSGSIWFTNQKKDNNALLSSSTQLTGSKYDIYESLVDENGNPAPINMQLYRFAYQQNAPANYPTLKFLDWLNRPLDEIRLNETTNTQNDYRLLGGLKYQFLKYFSLDASFQVMHTRIENESYHDKESYYVRNLVNLYTQPNGNRIIPYNGIMEYAPIQNTKVKSGRALLSYNQRFTPDHVVSALAAFEIRQSTTSRGFGQTIYNFNKDTWTGSAIYDFNTFYPTQPNSIDRIPTRASIVPSKVVNRDLSYFGNASYTFRQKYIASGSMRWDGSNLLGVRANQRGTILWSGGLSWNISKEDFYKLTEYLPYLRLRATYGSAGNIDRTQSSMPVMNVVTNTVTGLQTGILTSAGNPSLRWEQVNTMNFGADWRILKDRISGSIEFYQKDSKYLLGSNSVDPTTGVPSNFKLNYAAMRAWGWDIQIRSRNVVAGDFEWTTNLLINTSRNKVVKIKENPPTNDNNYFINSALVEQGKSVDRIYALPWHGLNPENGSVLIYDKSGAIRTDYNTWYQNVKKSEFVDAGLIVPSLTGSVMNTFEWKGIAVSALITGKFNYVFRRNSMMPGAEYSSLPAYHMDYFQRWKQPGDEKITNVPAKVPVNKINNDVTAQANVYRYSEALITPGDHIRLQDVSISYSLSPKLLRKLPIQSVRIYGYARSLGIIWRKNDQGLDPDFPYTIYPEPKSYSAGLQVEF